MNDKAKIELLRQTIKEMAMQLEKWAQESSRGGWSTHQVEPQLRWSSHLSRVYLVTE